MTATFRLQTEPPAVFLVREGRETEVPALWLRERSSDDAHLDPRTEQRLFDPTALPDDLKLTGAAWDDEAADDAALRLSFSDGYSGRFPVDLLLADLDPDDGCPSPRPWRADLDPLPYHDWPRMTEDGPLQAALHDFLARGFIILRGVPTEPEAILDVAGHFGHVRETNFGRYFEVYSRPASNDLAYRAVALGPHTDNPYREPVPGIQMLHCLVNETTGGLSTLADSLAVGEALAAEDPSAYDLLCTVPVRFRFVDENEELIERRTIIRRDAFGRMTGVHYSPRLDFTPLMDPDRLRRFHRARQKLGSMLQSPDFELRFALGPGELVMFDNSRLLHGRTGFDPSEGRRHLQGCYIDPDGPRSLYRVVSERLATPDAA